MIILSLYDYTGVWSKPYESDYEVIRVDLQHGEDALDPRWDRLCGVHGILAAPPCTHFATSGARWFGEKDKDGRTAADVLLVERVLELVQIHEPAWWALENPRSRIHKLIPALGAPSFKFNPYDFGEPISKETWIWGDFKAPVKGPVVEPEGMRPGQPPAWYSKVGGRQGIAGKNYRSKTSPAFAAAFAKANP